jgi:hypothetical protein
MSDTQTSEWIEHDGKGIPVGIRLDDEVQRKYRDGVVGSWMSTREAQNLGMWTHRNSDDDIVAYRVVKP